MAIVYAYLMEEIRELKLDQFLLEATLERLKVFMLDTEDARDWGDARGLLSIFDVKFPELLDPTKIGFELAKEYRKLWAWAVFMSFPAVKDEQIELLYREHILSVFEHFEDPRKILDEQLALVAYTDVYAKRLVVIAQALQENRERIGSGQILRASGKTVPPEVDWWLTEYRGFIGPSIKRAAVEQASFLSKNRSVAALSAPERTLLTKVIQFLDYLYFPTFASNAENPSYLILREDEWQRAQIALQELGEHEAEQEHQDTASKQQDIGPSSTPAQTVLVHPIPVAPPRPTARLAPATPRSTPPPPPIDREKYWNEFVVLHTTDLHILVEQLKSGRVPAGDVVPVVRAIVGSGNAEMLLPDQPLTAPAMAAILRGLYQRAGSTDSQSAQEAVHIGSLLKKQGKPEFLQMAYFDMGTNQFQWM